MDKNKKIIIGAGIAAGAGLAAYLAIRKRPPKPPTTITLSNLSITPATVSPGQTVTISVLATNHSSSALSALITLGGDFTDSQAVDLEGAASQTVTFTVTPTLEKTYHITLDGLSGSFVCTSAPHGDIALSNLVISPASCNEGDTVTISVTATNNGNVNEVMGVRLSLVGSKYNDSWEEVHQIILESGASQVVTFSFQPSVAQTYSVTVDGLSGSFVVNPPPTWPGWTAGTVVYEIKVTPTVIYLGETVEIDVDFEGPFPATYPMDIEATITVNGATISKVFHIEVYSKVLFTYTPTHLGEYTVTAQDKSATFTVLQNVAGTYYSPLGGTRMPLCTQLTVPNVPAFDSLFYGSFPGGDYLINGVSVFFTFINEVKAHLSEAYPSAWSPTGANVKAWAKSIGGTTMKTVVVMATDYTCQEYWDSKDELAKMIAAFAHLRIIPPGDLCSVYGHYIVCSSCGGTGTHYGRECQSCHGAGQIWICRFSLGAGLRDWNTIDNFYIVQYYDYTYIVKIKCPYCFKYLITGSYSRDPGSSGSLDAAKALIEHIELAHPNHPLTEPAWF